MKALCSGMAVAAVLMTSGCQAKEPQTQVVYRFDDHRYLELKGWDCEGELWYTDMQRGIYSEVVSQFYRIFTKKYVHPSERYIAIPTWHSPGSMVSKDYGKTWYPSSFSPGENEPNGDNAPPYDDILSFTVVNDQGFLLTKHRLYMSSRPFDDPRLATGGPGIDYVVEGVTHRIKPQSPGPAWGLDYITKEALENDTAKFHTNYQNLPDKVPEVKGYTGWDHMQCDMDAGR
ncbi:T6SS immunity protein Tli3 family protein [Enterobacter chuandaensis]|uniref:T6SS immunity protein Tli3 family protein n=1 Tax=Enterobacter chuandaensis TaxID=2497875 RepID=UPI003AB692DA